MSEILTFDQCKRRLKFYARRHAQLFWEQSDHQHPASVSLLLKERSKHIDQIIKEIWAQFDVPAGKEIALVATGGYGREELHPHSDIDLLILLRDFKQLESDSGSKERIEGLIAFLWDSGLRVGHSVRSLKACVEASSAIETMTALVESRLIVGSQLLHQQLKESISSKHIWTSLDFFYAKWKEQTDRRAKQTDSEQNLQPNIKVSPGGLRDLQTIDWIAARHFQIKVRDYQELIQLGFLDKHEAVILREARAFLQHVRYGLHVIADRAEECLLFEHQRELANKFGYQDDARHMGVEKLMQSYYRHAQHVVEINDLLMTHFEQEIVLVSQPEHLQRLNLRFNVRNNDIEAVDESVFRNTPSALLEIFVLMGRHRHIRGIRAATVRMMREQIGLIDDKFRQDSKNNRLFLEFLRSPHLMSERLALMKRLGILGAYLPEFGRVVGKMQYDLFHIYTVDAHTLQVIRNMRRFNKSGEREIFSLAAQIVQRLQDPILLYIAGLYHDIGKGRGGNHSELGAQDAREFCRRHNLSASATQLVEWLVRNHLLMSHTAQRKDIGDPEVIHEFVDKIGETRRLDYLYCLTVADINATNPKLWTSWLSSLMRRLYLKSLRMLRSEQQEPQTRQSVVKDMRRRAKRNLEKKAYSQRQIEEAWGAVDDEYFMRESLEDIVWQTCAMIDQPQIGKPLVLIKHSSVRYFEGAMQIFVRVKNRDNIFAVIAMTLDQLQLNIQDARIFRTARSFSINTFYVLGPGNRPLNESNYNLDGLRDHLVDALSASDNELPNIPKHRVKQHLFHFRVDPEVSIFEDAGNRHSVVELSALDRPGLLAHTARIFLELNLRLKNARVATFGERVEDVFFITNRRNQPLRNPSLQRELKERLLAVIQPPAQDAPLSRQAVVRSEQRAI